MKAEESSLWRLSPLPVEGDGAGCVFHYLPIHMQIYICAYITNWTRNLSEFLKKKYQPNRLHSCLQFFVEQGGFRTCSYSSLNTQISTLPRTSGLGFLCEFWKRIRWYTGPLPSVLMCSGLRKEGEGEPMVAVLSVVTETSMLSLGWNVHGLFKAGTLMPSWESLAVSEEDDQSNHSTNVYWAPAVS